MEDGRDLGCIGPAQTGKNVAMETVFEVARKLSGKDRLELVKRLMNLD
jgi:hypothetical protein